MHSKLFTVSRIHLKMYNKYTKKCCKFDLWTYNEAGCSKFPSQLTKYDNNKTIITHKTSINIYKVTLYVAHKKTLYKKNITHTPVLNEKSCHTQKRLVFVSY